MFTNQRNLTVSLALPLTVVLGSCASWFDKSGCERYVRSDQTLNVNGIKAALGKVVPVEVGHIDFSNKYPPVSDDSTKLDLAQYQLCKAIANTPDGAEKSKRQSEYLDALAKILVDAGKSNPNDVKTPSQTGDQPSKTAPATAPATAVRRIDQPVVNRPDGIDTDITVSAGDEVVIKAGGCVQTGGSGKTWKRYVDPIPSDKYYGTVEITGALARSPLSTVVGKKIQIQAGVANAKLHVGYVDDNYGDNGYWGRDDGTNDQCRGQPDAYIEVNITHR